MEILYSLGDAYDWYLQYLELTKKLMIGQIQKYFHWLNDISLCGSVLSTERLIIHSHCVGNND